jgi:hypothetical protein
VLPARSLLVACSSHETDARVYNEHTDAKLLINLLDLSFVLTLINLLVESGLVPGGAREEH